MARPMSEAKQVALRLAAEVRVDWRTAQRWLLQDGETLPSTAYALRAAAERLKIDLSAHPVGQTAA